MARPSLAMFTKALGKSKRPLISPLEALSKTFETPEPITKSEQSKLVTLIKEALSKPLEERSSQVPVETHFRGLFEGLDALTDLNSPSKSLLSSSDEQRLHYIHRTQGYPDKLIAVLDELYYHRRLSKPVAAAILKSKSITDVSPFMKILNNTGSLVRWSVSTRYMFALQVANKYFALKQVDMARTLIVGWYETSWSPLMKSSQLSTSVVYGLGRAIFALNEDQLLIQDCAGWSEDTFTSSSSKDDGFSVSLAFRTAVFPLTKAALLCANNNNRAQSSVLPVLNTLIDAGFRCNSRSESQMDSQNAEVYAANELMLQSLRLLVQSMEHRGTGSHVTKSFLAALDTIASPLIGKPTQAAGTHWNVRLMGHLLDASQEAQDVAFSRELLALIQQYVANHLDQASFSPQDDINEVSVAAVRHKLHTYQLHFR